MKKKRAIAYTRMFNGVRNVIEQENIIAKFADDNNYDVLAYYCDTNVGYMESSDSVLTSRNGMTDILDYSFGLQWQYLIVWRLPVLVRDDCNIPIKDIVERFGKTIVSVDGYETPKHIREMFADAEVPKSRTKIPKSLKQGGDVERFVEPSFGYARAIDHKLPYYVTKPEEVAVVQKIFITFIMTESVRQVSEYLMSLDIPCPKECGWKRHLVRFVLSDPAYSGQSSIYPAIIAPHIYAQARAILLKRDSSGSA